MSGSLAGLLITLAVVFAQFPVAWLATHRKGQSFKEWVGRW